jgi:hypothetical protein
MRPTFSNTTAVDAYSLILLLRRCAQPFLVVGRELRPVNLQRQLIELAREPKGHLVIFSDRSAGVGA